MMAFLEALKTLSLITVPFAVYFAWIKIGHKVGASYSWVVGRLEAPGIGTVTLINMKDRPLAIFEVHAVMDDLSISLKRFDPPFILKAMEAVTIEAERVSTRYLGSEEYEWKNPFGKTERIVIHLTTSSRVIRCRHQGPPSQVGFAIRQNLKLVTNSTSRFNDLIYNKNVKYALTYIEDKKQHTAFIDTHGIIYWNRIPNALRPHDLTSVETVKKAIIDCGLAPYISPFSVDELHTKDEKQASQTSLTIPKPRSARLHPG